MAEPQVLRGQSGEKKFVASIKRGEFEIALTSSGMLVSNVKEILKRKKAEKKAKNGGNTTPGSSTTTAAEAADSTPSAPAVTATLRSTGTIPASGDRSRVNRDLNVDQNSRGSAALHEAGNRNGVIGQENGESNDQVNHLNYVIDPLTGETFATTGGVFVVRDAAMNPIFLDKEAVIKENDEMISKGKWEIQMEQALKEIENRKQGERTGQVSGSQSPTVVAENQRGRKATSGRDSGAPAAKRRRVMNEDGEEDVLGHGGGVDGDGVAPESVPSGVDAVDNNASAGSKTPSDAAPNQVPELPTDMQAILTAGVPQSPDDALVVDDADALTTFLDVENAGGAELRTASSSESGAEKVIYNNDGTTVSRKVTSSKQAVERSGDTLQDLPTLICVEVLQHLVFKELNRTKFSEKPMPSAAMLSFHEARTGKILSTQDWVHQTSLLLPGHRGALEGDVDQEDRGVDHICCVVHYFPKLTLQNMIRPFNILMDALDDEKLRTLDLTVDSDVREADRGNTENQEGGKGDGKGKGQGKGRPRFERVLNRYPEQAEVERACRKFWLTDDILEEVESWWDDPDYDFREDIRSHELYQADVADKEIRIMTQLLANRVVAQAAYGQPREFQEPILSILVHFLRHYLPSFSLIMENHHDRLSAWLIAHWQHEGDVEIAEGVGYMMCAIIRMATLGEAEPQWRMLGINVPERVSSLLVALILDCVSRKTADSIWSLAQFSEIDEDRPRRGLDDGEESVLALMDTEWDGIRRQCAVIIHEMDAHHQPLFRQIITNENTSMVLRVASALWRNPGVVSSNLLYPFTGSCPLLPRNLVEDEPLIQWRGRRAVDPAGRRLQLKLESLLDYKAIVQMEHRGEQPPDECDESDSDLLLVDVREERRAFSDHKARVKCIQFYNAAKDEEEDDWRSKL